LPEAWHKTKLEKIMAGTEDPRFDIPRISIEM
jgi:hypothetical protein